MRHNTQRDPIQPLWIRPSDWQRLTGMKHRETYRRIEIGEIRARRVDRQIYIPASELVEYFQRVAVDAAA